MKAILNKIGIAFDENHLKSYNLGNGIQLQRAEAWRGREGDDRTNTKMETNVNHLETNPQIGTVIIENDEYPYKKGDVVFMHYLAYETFEDKVEVDGQDVYLIAESFIFFTIVGDELKMKSKHYLGRVKISDPPKTTSGIYLTSLEVVKDDLRVNITHVPGDERKVCEVGEEVIPIDKSNYPIKLGDIEYVLLKEQEIVAKIP